jgi:hypothetical protein
MEINIEAPQKLKIELPYDLVIPLLAIDPKEMKSAPIETNAQPRFITALLTMDKLWNQPRCPSTDEQIKKTWYIYTMEFYLTIKKNEILLFSGKWMELEISM